MNATRDGRHTALNIAMQEQQAERRDGRSWWRVGCVSVVALCLLAAGLAAASGGPAAAVDAPAQQQVQQSTPNTVTIRSTGEERVFYTISVSGSIEAGPGADLTGAEQPDSVEGTTATGSTALNGVDNFTFRGRITALNVSGGPVEVSVNGTPVDPSTFPQSTTTVSSTATPTRTSTSTPTQTRTPTATSTPTSTGTATPTIVTPTATPTPASPSTTTTAPSATPTASPTPSATANATTQPQEGESGGILGSVSLFTVVGTLLLVVFAILALVAHYND